ncbi:MAG: heavy metal translocating P-type ATPase [Caldilineaceae bacterium]
MLPMIGIGLVGALTTSVIWRKQRNATVQLLIDYLCPAAKAATAPSSTGGMVSTALDRVTTSLAELENRYQYFLQRHLDQLLSGGRYAQWRDLHGGEDRLEITPLDKQQNRSIARLTGVVVTALLAKLYTPWLLLTIPLAAAESLVWAQRVYQDLRSKRQLKMEHMAVICVSGFWITGNFVIGGLSCMVFGLVSKVILQTHDRTRKAMVNILGEQPRLVWVLVNGLEMEIPFDHLQEGDILVVQAGQVIPVDGIIRQGEAAIDQQHLTGEAQPVEKGVGDPVFAATLILSGRLFIRVEKTGTATLALQIGDILSRTLDYHLTVEERGRTIADGWAKPSLLVAGLAAVTLGLESTLAILSNLPGMDMVLLGPLALLNYLNLASRNQVLIKDGRSLDLLHTVDTVIFDKTGTLTLAQPHVTTIHCCADLDADTLLTCAAAAEQRQSHPIAKAILAAAQERNLPCPPLADVQVELGFGLRVWLAGEDKETGRQGDRETTQNPKSKIQNSLIRVGSARFMTMESVPVPDEMAAIQTACHDVGHSLVLVAVGEQLVGAIELQQTIRPEARDIVAALHKRKLATVIISGDQEAPTRKLAQTLGIDRYFANVLPEGKAALVEGLQAEGRSVCFVGDGINDAIALKRAQVSVSLRSATTIATDTAQVILMDQTLTNLPALIDLAHELERKLMTSLVLVTVPGCLVIGGVFLLHIGIPVAVTAYTTTFAVGVVNVMEPVFRKRLAVDGAADG